MNILMLYSRKVSKMLLGKSGRQLLIATEMMERLSQCRNDAQLWVRPVVKVKSNSAENNIAQNVACQAYESR